MGLTIITSAFRRFWQLLGFGKKTSTLPPLQPLPEIEYVKIEKKFTVGQLVKFRSSIQSSYADTEKGVTLWTFDQGIAIVSPLRGNALYVHLRRDLFDKPCIVLSYAESLFSFRKDVEVLCEEEILCVREAELVELVND